MTIPKNPTIGEGVLNPNEPPPLAFIVDGNMIWMWGEISIEIGSWEDAPADEPDDPDCPF